MGDFSAGISVGYVMAREFEPVENSFKYRPGNQLSVRGAIDRNFGNAGKASVTVSVQSYDADRIDQRNLFQAGRRYQGVGSYAFALGGTGAGIVYVGYLRRNEGEYLDPQRVLPVQALLFTGTGLELPTRVGLIRPSVDLRMMRRDDGIGQGYTLSAGVEFERSWAQFTLVPTVRGRFGNVLLRQNAESGFTGFDVGLSVRFGEGGQ
jgi:hypothetical protein